MAEVCLLSFSVFSSFVVVLSCRSQCVSTYPYTPLHSLLPFARASKITLHLVFVKQIKHSHAEIALKLHNKSFLSLRSGVPCRPWGLSLMKFRIQCRSFKKCFFNVLFSIIFLIFLILQHQMGKRQTMHIFIPSKANL